MAKFILNDDGSFTQEKKRKKQTSKYEELKNVPFTGQSKFKTQSEDKYFKKSKGNAGQAIGYSALDALGNITEGFLKGYEGISDWGRNRGADIVDFFGADEYAKELRERSKQDDTADIVKQWNHITSGDLSGTKAEEEIGNFKKVKENTIFGDKSGQVFQGIGNSLASTTAGLASGGALATPSFFMSASGNSEVEALNNGATVGEARLYGALSGTIEAGSERLFGGLGKLSEKFGLGKGVLDDQVTRLLTKNMKSSLMKNITTLGIKSVGEGLEEVAAGFGNALAQKLTYMKDEEIGQLIKDQNLMDSFVNGMLSSALMQSPSTITYTAQGRDVNTGLTRTQQQYVNEIAQQRMVEAQRRNARLNGFEKAKIEDRALTDYQRGRLADANKLQQVNLPGLSTKDMDLQQSAYKYGFNPNSEAIITAKTMLDNRGIKSRFDAEAFKGSNENSFWTKKSDGTREVVFNPNASEQTILEEIAIHELTHDLMSSENSKDVIENQKIMDYVSTLDGYEEARTKVEELYAEKTKKLKTEEEKIAYIDEEIVADTLGKNIGSQEYIRRLIDDEPSIAKNIYDWVVNKVANKNGVKNEKAYWNNVKNNFEKAYNMSYEGKNNTTDTRHSLIGPIGAKTAVKADPKNKEIVDLLKEAKNKKRKNILLKIFNKGYSNEDIRKSTMWFQDDDGNWWIEISDANIKLIDDLKQNHEYTLKDILVDNGDTRNLFAAYPKLENQRVKTTTLDGLADGEEINGQYNVDEDVIELNNKYLKEKSMRRTLLHEMQHIIQTIEGTDNGASGQNMIEYMTSMGELEAKETAERADMTQKELYENAPRSSKKNPIFPILEMMNKYPNSPKTKELLKNKDIAKLYDEIYNNGKKGEYNRAKIHKDALREVQKEAKKDGSGKMLPMARGRGIPKSGTRREVKELDNSSFSMSEQLENQASNLVEEDIQTRNAMLDNFKSYLEEYDITNPTQEDIDNSLIDLLSYDNDMTPAETLKYEKQYKEVVNEYLKGQKTTTDNQGRKLTKEQQEFFKDSKVRDSEGRLLEVYHGSENEFNIFDIDRAGARGSHYTSGFYFTNSEESAKDYATHKGKVYKTYLNITNPYIPSADIINKDGSVTFAPSFYEEFEQKFKDKLPIDWKELNSARKGTAARYILQDMGYDGVINGHVYVAFEPNQIKNVDNTNPTEDADIRYSQQNEEWQSFLDNNFEAKGTKTRLGDIKLPGLTKAVQEEVQKPVAPKVTKPVKNENLPLRKETAVLKLDANQIADALNGNTKEKIQVPGGKKLRRWSETSTKSDVLKDFIGINELDINKITYVPISNRKTLENADNKLSNMSYEEGIEYIKGQLTSGQASLTDIAIAEKLIVEARNRQDAVTYADLLMDVSILGTELGQKVQALSIIQKMTPEGQLKMYQKILTRAKSKGAKGFENVEITPDMVKTILDAYDKNGNYNQDDLNNRVEVFKQQIAEQMTSTLGEKANEWRYLSMLGNPKTHIRNVVSNVAMKGTLSVKNAIARTIEMALPQAKRTKTWEQASSYVKGFAEQTAEEWKGIISGESKYSETQQLNKMKKTFKSETLNKLSNLNSNLLEVEDWFFSKSAFKKSLQEYLTAQGIKTEQDIANNPEIVEKAKMHALEQAQIATFRQYSWLANKINEIENKNKATKVLVGAVMPFKKTPINVAKAGISYSPLGLIKTMTYDLVQLKNGNMEASQFIDNLSQGLTGTSLTLLGYALASAGFITGGSDDDKEGKYDYALGNQTYALKIGNNTYSISWLSPVAMPLLVGANAFSELEEKEEWDANVLINTLASTLDPISEMSFISSLTDVLQSYQQGSMQMISNMGQSAFSSYVTQYFPTLFSQIASVFDDKKRSTRASGDSKFKYGEELFNQIRYKIPGLRNTLPVATDIWGNEQKQADSMVQRAFETFIAPYNRKSVSNTALDKEIKRLYSETGETAVIPGTPKGYIQYKDERYDMNNAEYVAYKKTYGTKANSYLNSLIATDAYKSATDDEKSKMVQEIYGYAGAYAKKDFFSNREVEYTSDDIKAINKFEELKMNSNDVGEFVAINKLSSTIKNNKDLDASEKRTKTGELMLNANLKDNQLAYLYSKYYSSEEKLDTMLTMEIPIKQFIKFDVADIQGKYNSKTGKTINGSKKNATIEYVNGLNLSKAQKAILIKDAYNTYDRYNNDIIRYVNNLSGTANDKKVWLKSIGFDNYDRDVVRYIKSQGLSQEETEKKLDELGFTIRDGRVYY